MTKVWSPGWLRPCWRQNVRRGPCARLITHYFGVVWRVPFGLLAVLCLFVAGAAALAVHGPVKRLQAMPVTAAINEL